jgi:sulfide dehydrogenase cytochrome subunit
MKSSLATAAGLVVVCWLSPIFSAVAQEAVKGRSLAANCFTCHGTNGNSAGGVPPSLAGRDRAEIFQTMKDFQSGKRAATIMHQQAKGYTDEQLQLIAAYIAELKPAPARMPARATY